MLSARADEGFVTKMVSANLLERGAEARAIAEAVNAAASGSGRVLLVEGEAGIGKTALLELLGRRASRRGMVVETARGGRLEREFPFAIPRRLFETTLARRPKAARRSAPSQRPTISGRIAR